MLKIYITGIALGIALPQFLSDKDYKVLYQGLYQPHKDFKKVKKDLLKADLSLTEKHYFNYFKESFKSFGNTLYYFPYGKYRQLMHEKQKACYKLIENFEFVKETIENIDYIMGSIQELEKEQTNTAIIEGSYQHMKLLEEEAKALRRSADDNNLEYLQRVKESSKDEYEKYLLENAVMEKGDYLRKLTPEFKLEREQNKLRLLENYYNSLQKFKEARKGEDIEEKFTVYRSRMNELAMNKWHDAEAKRIQKEKEMKKQEEEESKEIKAFKQPTSKSVEKEIEMLKDIFGSR